mgnify:CR=1 FL=1
MKKRALIGVAIAVCVALGAWGFDAMFESVTRKVWIGYRGEAAKQPFLAAERFLDSLGMRPERIGSAESLDGMAPNAATLIGPDRQSLTAEQIDHLLAWASAGNHLIVAPQIAALDDPLLDRLEIRRDRPAQRKAIPQPIAPGDEENPSTSTSTPIEGTTAKGCGGKERIAEIALPGSPRIYLTSIGHSPSLAFEPNRMDFIWSGDQGIQLTSQRWGEGRVTVMPIQMFTNERIGQFDHAALLHAVAAWNPGTVAVGFFDKKDRRSLLAWIMEHMLWVVVAATIMTMLLIWRAMIRFGPIAPDPDFARRSLIDHLAAAGRFRWRAGNRMALVGAARAFVTDQAARSVPGFAQLSAGEQQERLCVVTGLPADQTHYALTGIASKPSELIQMVSVLRRIHIATTGARALRTKKGTV